MDEYADIYYVDTRNAPDIRVENRTGGHGQTVRHPMQPSRTVYMPRQQYGQPGFPQSSYQQPFIYNQPQSPFGTFFGKLTSGQVIDMVAQLFAMLQPLPGAPVATADSSTDIGNSILYQSALATYAKRDEQIRTLGGLVAKLIG